MATSKEDGTAAAAKQLSESVGKKDNENESNEDAEKNGTPTTKLCSACGKERDALKKCAACKCAWYCDKECQNKHRREHRQECKAIKKVLEKRGGRLDVGTEVDLGPLGKLPPREECPICMRVLPNHTTLQVYAPCCGKIICGGCELQHQMKNGKQTETPCAFCREPISESDEKTLAWVGKRVECNDLRAMREVALAYGYGRHGLSVDQTKCIELLRQSADLGYPQAQSQLGTFYHDGGMGLEQNYEEALKYWQKAAEGGEVLAWHNRGCFEYGNDNHVAAVRHFRMSASGGYRISMENLIICFEVGLVHHGDLAEVLQAFYLARAERRSKDRDLYIEHLKKNGQYKESYSL